MYILTRKNRVIDYCESGYIYVGNTVVCEGKRCKFEDATIVNIGDHPLPSDIDSSVYEYIAGEFIRVNCLDRIKESKSLIEVDIITPTGSDVLATDGATEVHAISELDHALVSIPHLGNWSFISSNSRGDISTTVSLNIDAPKYYNIELPLNYRVYGVSIDLNEFRSGEGINYTDRALTDKLTKGSSSWDNTPIFKNIKPCILADYSDEELSSPTMWITPNNFSKYRKGTSTTNYSVGSSQHCWIQLPKLGYRITKDNWHLSVQVTDSPNAVLKGFRYYAHTKDNEGDRDYIYIGAYMSSIDSKGNLAPLSGASPTTNMSISGFRAAINNRCNIMSIHQLILLQCLFLIRYKSRDSQSSLGRGRVDISSENYTPRTTNCESNSGMYNGNEEYVRFAGIEDLWGNVSSYIDGLLIGDKDSDDGYVELYTKLKNFNDTAAGYRYIGNIKEHSQTSIVEVIGSTEGGFLCSSGKAPSPLGYPYPDTSITYTEAGESQSFSVASHGGAGFEGDGAGIFCMDLGLSPSKSYDNVVGVRLVCM